MTDRIELRLSDKQLRILEAEAKGRGISVQDLLRSVIIPDWCKMWGPKA